jgi:RNA polymerase sigma-70 factor (ECF subfamily)
MVDVTPQAGGHRLDSLRAFYVEATVMLSEVMVSQSDKDDDDTQAHVFGQLRHFLVRRLRRMLASRGVAEDLCQDFAQEALLKVYVALPTFRNEGSLEAWALSIALRVAFDEMKRKRWQDVPYDLVCADDAKRMEPKHEASQASAMERVRIAAQLRRLIHETLTVRQRRVLLAVLDDVAAHEAASGMGMKMNALYKLEHDARRRMKRSLESAGYSASDLLGAFE